MNWPVLAALVLALAPLTAWADTVSERADAIALTLYRSDSLPSYIGGGLALVTETRTVDLPAGPTRLEFRGVADTLAPQSAEVDGLPGPVAESDFDYSLLSPASLVAAAVGRRVQVVRTNPKTGRAQTVQAVIRAGPEGVVLDEGQGRVEALHCSGLPERLVFDAIPPALTDRPTLSVRTVAPRAGRYRVTLRYLATGFDWSADYVARLNPDGRTLDLQGWLTLKNDSATGFVRAPTQVVAGQVARTGDDRAILPPSRDLATDCWPALAWWEIMRGRGLETPRFRVATRVQEVVTQELGLPLPPAPPAPMARQSELGDYKLYTLPEPTTVSAHQNKQVLFLNQARVTYAQAYTYEVPAFLAPGMELDPRTRVTLKLSNVAAAGLGRPLPSGRIAAMAPAPAGSLLFAGADRIGDTPVGLPLEVALGRSAEVQAATRLVSQSFGPGRTDSTLEVRFSNATRASAEVELTQAAVAGQKVTFEDRPHEMKNGSPRWTLVLPPGGQALLHYHLERTG